MTERVVVVGAGLAGARVAQELRAQQFGGGITLVGAERYRPYDRPPLSKQVLQGRWRPDRALLSYPSEPDDVDLRLGTRARRIHLGERQVILDAGEPLHFDALVVATGACPRTLPGRAPEGVHVLRTLDDCLAIRSQLARGGPLVVVGAGFIGGEVAAVARSLGVEVTLVEASPAPLTHVLGPDVGDRCAELHRDHGVRLRCNVAVEGFDGDPRVERVRLSDGSSLDADLVVVGVGVVPNTGWLESSGLALRDGVICDRYCRADQANQIYALSDVARWFNPLYGRHTRVEHWTTATEQSHIVAHNIINPANPRSYAAAPYFWSDQYGHKIQFTGHAEPDHCVRMIPGPKGGRQFVALFSSRDRLCAALTFGWPRAIAVCRPILTRRGTLAEALREIHDMV
ncbi:MAG: NAD(P)/FAD-dependent oxidoreductase [Carbonactinosporaceae bacterium]